MWLEYDLFQVSDFSIGGTPSRNEPNYWSKKPDGTPWVAISDLKKKFLTETEEHVSDQGARNSNVKLVPKNTVLMSFKLSIGRVCITGSDVYTNEAIAAFYPRREKLDHRFLYHILPDSALSTVTDNAIKGATLNKQKIAKIKLRIPSSVEEQKKISDILDKADDAIEKTQALITKYENIKQGMMQDLFTRGVYENGQLRPSYEEAPHLYQETELGWIPKDWQVQQLKNLSDMSSGGTPSRENADYWGGDIPWVKTGEVDYELILNSEEKITQKGLDYSSAKIVNAGAVIMAMYGQGVTRGKVAILGIDASMNQACLAIQTSGGTHNIYLYHYLVSQYENLRKIVQEGTQKNLSATIVGKIYIPTPSIEEQKLIANILNELDAVIKTNKQQLEKTREQKLGLMRDLLTGKVRVAEDMEERKEAVA